MKTGYTSMKVKLRRSVVHMTATRMAKTLLKKLERESKMGTNYYWYSTNQCPTCHHIEAPLHIGKVQLDGHLDCVFIQNKISIH